MNVSENGSQAASSFLAGCQIIFSLHEEIDSKLKKFDICNDQMSFF